MINFNLEELDKILPWGQEPNLSLHWYALTYGDLWLTIGNSTIYEYSKEAIEFFGNKVTPYNNYQLSRFIEDFTGLFDKISEKIPKEFYDLTKDLTKFQNNAKKWLDIYDTDEDEHSDFYFEEYDKLVSWTYQRSFDSAHLIGGPYLSFFRGNDKIRIVWETEDFLDNGISIWTAKDGSFEMDYSDFMNEIKMFGESFFFEMEKQIELVLEKEWGNIKIDKQRLVEEHKEKKNEFFSNLLLLNREPIEKTNWNEVFQLYDRMKKEI